VFNYRLLAGRQTQLRVFRALQLENELPIGADSFISRFLANNRGKKFLNARMENSRL
jgi:hypothetical protein